MTAQQVNAVTTLTASGCTAHA